MAASPGFLLGIWLILGGPSSALQGGRGMIPISWGDPGIKALLEAPPSCCGVFQRVRAAPWISPTGMCQQGNPECASGNENSPNLGQLLSHPLGCPAGIPRAAPEEPLGCSCLDPAVPWDKSQRNRVELKEFASSAAASSPRNFGRGTSLFCGVWVLLLFPIPRQGLDWEEISANSSCSQGCTKCCFPPREGQKGFQFLLP